MSKRTWGIALSVLALALFCQVPAHAAVNCGDIVQGFVLLTADLNCTGNGLIVGADNTWIALNGHAITCTGAGFGGSCQFLNGPEGIASFKRHNVYITGPGTVNGFHVGIALNEGSGYIVNGVTITGPPAPDASTNTRNLSVGIVMGQATCPLSFLALPSAIVIGNEISNHTMGIQLSSSSCVDLVNNNIHDNTGPSDAHGIDVINSSSNLVVGNNVHNNGINNPIGNPDSGITMLGNGSFGNQILNNTVENNCGNGIVAFAGALNNNVANNLVKFQALDDPPQCKPLPIANLAVTIFWDLAQFNQGPGNVWNANNQCLTQSPGIPAGICHP